MAAANCRFEEYVGQITTLTAAVGASAEEGHAITPNPFANKHDKETWNKIEHVRPLSCLLNKWRWHKCV